MKTHLLSLLLYLLTPSWIIAQSKMNGILPVIADRVVYQKTVNIDSASKDEIFKRARKWFVKSYNQPNQAIQLTDPATGEISANGLISVSIPIARVVWSGDIAHTIMIEAKDRKCRITLDNLRVRSGSQNWIPISEYKLPYLFATQSQYNKFYEGVNERLLNFVSDLHKSIQIKDDF